MTRFHNLFKSAKPVIGMIHVDALPGAPKYSGNVKDIITNAIAEAEIYLNNGVDSIAIENMHDVPYLKNSVGHEISTLMSIIAYEIKNRTKLPTGIQILAGANKEALASANSAGLDFIRAEGFVFAHVADEGIIESNAGELLRFRKQIGADKILIFTDIKKKHSSHAITCDVDIVKTATAADFFLSDGVVLTGSSTGKKADIDEIKSVSLTVNIPVIIGSGITADNVEKYFNAADAFIVGSHFKKDGNWFNSVDANKVKSFMDKINALK